MLFAPYLKMGHVSKDGMSRSFSSGLPTGRLPPPSAERYEDALNVPGILIFNCAAHENDIQRQVEKVQIDVMHLVIANYSTSIPNVEATLKAILTIVIRQRSLLSFVWEVPPSATDKKETYTEEVFRIFQELPRTLTFLSATYCPNLYTLLRLTCPGLTHLRLSNADPWSSRMKGSPSASRTPQESASRQLGGLSGISPRPAPTALKLQVVEFDKASQKTLVATLMKLSRAVSPACCLPALKEIALLAQALGGPAINDSATGVYGYSYVTCPAVTTNLLLVTVENLPVKHFNRLHALEVHCKPVKDDILLLYMSLSNLELDARDPDAVETSRTFRLELVIESSHQNGLTDALNELEETIDGFNLNCNPKAKWTAQVVLNATTDKEKAEAIQLKGGVVGHLERLGDERRSRFVISIGASVPE
ncbi:hypothetical protein DXG01_015984 [Tephrocybe rancida]|nr:hypothetical protein DXG01_015984 [Tephrocybe rancida]